MNPDQLAAAVGAEAAREMSAALSKITHCLSQLTEEQVWHRSHPSLNSIGNLILHLSGNVHQWLVAGLTGAPDTRDRSAEFAERGPIPKHELQRRLENVTTQAKQVLERLTAHQLLEARRIQGFDVSGLGAIFSSVPHFRGHAQEIIHMTRLQLGDGYKTAWEPGHSQKGPP